MIEPTAEVRSRDLTSDLELARRVITILRQDGLPDVERNRALVAEWIDACITGWPTALIRAIWAEAKLAESSDEIDHLRDLLAQSSPSDREAP